MFSKIKEKLKNIGYNRQQRVMNYVEHIQEKIQLKSEKDQQIVSEINVLLDDRVKKIARLQIFTFALYFAIYFSIFSLFFFDIFFLSEVILLVNEIISFFGTAVFLVLLFFVQRWKELYYQDLNLLSSHLISIYNKQRYTDEGIFDDYNMYNMYLNYFRKKGF